MDSSRVVVAVTGEAIGDLEPHRGAVSKPMQGSLVVSDIVERVEAGSRVSVDEARVLWTDASDEELQRLAGSVRARYHEPDRATYLVMRIINYTNVCVAQCDYCAFYVLPNQEGGYVLGRHDVFVKMDELLQVGGDLAAFNGGFNPKLPLHYYCDLFRAVRERYGEAIEFYALTIAEFMYLADRARLSHRETALELKRAGVHWITGGGSEILTEDFRKRHAKFKYTVAEYFEAQRAIVEAGLRTTATMVIGFDETLEERLEHLDRTRQFQDQTGGLFSFLCWTYKPYGTALGGREISPREYHRHIALSRLFLDNIRHIRTSVLTLNEDAFRALDYGADDFDLPIEDEVTQRAGATIDLDLDRLLEIPRRMGYRVEYRRAERPDLLARTGMPTSDRPVSPGVSRLGEVDDDGGV
jgi:cyclic dehypoxanthinyl futalosine synthase